MLTCGVNRGQKLPMPLSNKLINFFASGFYISYIPIKIIPFKKNTGAGLFGSVLAFGLVWFLPSEKLHFIVFIFFFAAFSTWISHRASINYNNHDDPRIVIDEILGYWVSVAFLNKDFFPLISSFIFFRILDTLKPWPIKNLEKRLPNSFGIIIDDAIAGIEANILTRILLTLI
jgi:phosphatidylglycerophosphatase A